MHKNMRHIFRSVWLRWVAVSSSHRIAVWDRAQAEMLNNNICLLVKGRAHNQYLPLGLGLNVFLVTVMLYRWKCTYNVYYTHMWSQTDSMQLTPLDTSLDAVCSLGICHPTTVQSIEVSRSWYFHLHTNFIGLLHAVKGGKRPCN
jgi:hypothetical protein